MTTKIPERIVPGTRGWQTYFAEHIQRYEFASAYCNHKNVLDIACGVGYGSRYLLSKGALSVVGIDISSDAIQFANKTYITAGIRFAQDDACHLKLDAGTFDLVISFETIEHVSSPDLFIENIYRVLRPGGCLICSTPNTDFTPITGIVESNPYHISDLSLHDLERITTGRFVIRSIYGQTHTDSFRRHQLVVNELAKMNKTLRFNKILRFENAVRKLLGKETWDNPQLSPELNSYVSSDMQIEEYKIPSPHILTYILVMDKIK